jgi:tetratricopeptide (TPR) repeat protein
MRFWGWRERLARWTIMGERGAARAGHPRYKLWGMHWRKVATAAGLVAVIAGAAVLIHGDRPRARSPDSAAQPAFIPVRRSGDGMRVFDAYAGSASCIQCHREEFADWKRSNHGMAEREVQAAMDRRAFDPPRTFKHGTQQTEARGQGSRYEVVTPGPNNRDEPFGIERVIGNDPLRQFLVGFPGGRLQALEASYDPHRDEWFNVYGNEDRRPGEWGHWTGRGMNWNSMCAACHNTRLRKNYDEASDTYSTSMAEMTVSCEACHGPMKPHVLWRQANPPARARAQARYGDPTTRKASAEQVFDTCASCHSRRSELSGDFVPGDSYYDHYLPATVDESDTYYPDGQVRDEDYEMAAFLGSKMHKAGVRCLDCHDPHSGKVRLAGNVMCMKCHGGTEEKIPKIDPAKHSFHKVDRVYPTTGAIDLDAVAKRPGDEVIKNGGECVNCHMPQTIYMQRHRRHDHGFTIPDPLLTKECGIPNACNRCHADKDADWAISWTVKWWGAKMERPSRERARAIAAARLGQSGAEQRLLSILNGNESPYWKAVAANLLERWTAAPQVVGVLLGACRDDSSLVRASVARALGTLAGTGATEAEEALRQMLGDGARSVRFNAAWALRGSIDPKSPAGDELVRTLDFVADQPAGQMQRGAYLAARNDPHGALLHYQKAVSWDPNSAPMRHDLAVVLSGMGRTQEAVEQLEAACRLEPREAEFRYKLALAWNELGNIDKTIEFLNEAVRLNPAHARAWYNLGLALNSAGKSDEALAALRRAESADGTDARSPYARATILARLGRVEEAREAARRALEIRPDFEAAAELLRAMAERPAGAAR